MFDPISVIIFTLKNLIQRIRGIFSFVLDNYFPKKDEEEDNSTNFSFL
ncbi:MAG: hypothetical protein IJC79_00130 [Clostridia bacterium]|nr:hypothetical protein [Clostridia bacterium]